MNQDSQPATNSPATLINVFKVRPNTLPCSSRNAASVPR
jgi:hypothetical protein